MTFGRAVSTCLRKYFVLSGRAPRSEFWWFFLASIGFGLLFGILDAGLYGLSREPGPIELIGNFLILCPSITVAVRRLHDTDRSGWYILVPLPAAALAIAVGAILGPSMGQSVSISVGLILATGFLLPIWWYTRPTSPTTNRYGPNPLEVTP